jgi:hypothetical protein
MLLVLATPWAPLPPLDTTTTATTAPVETTSTVPPLIIEPPHLTPPGAPTATTTTTTAALIDPAVETRPLPRLPYTGPHNNLLLPGGILTLLGGLCVAAGRRAV